MAFFRMTLFTFALFWSLLPSFATAKDRPVPLDRLRVELVRKEPKRSVVGEIVYFSQLVKLQAGGIIHPRPGTTFRVTAVAYSPTVDQNDATPCITASGYRVGRDVVATNFLPLGTRIRIGENTRVVRDRMNEKYNGQYIIDIWHPTRREALAFGAQTLEIEILGFGEPEERAGTPAPTPSPEPPAGFLAEARERFQEFTGFFRQFVPGRAYLPPDVDCLTDTDGGRGEGGR